MWFNAAVSGAYSEVLFQVHRISVILWFAKYLKASFFLVGEGRGQTDLGKKVSNEEMKYLAKDNCFGIQATWKSLYMCECYVPECEWGWHSFIHSFTQQIAIEHLTVPNTLLGTEDTLVH